MIQFLYPEWLWLLLLVPLLVWLGHRGQRKQSNKINQLGIKEYVERNFRNCSRSLANRNLLFYLSFCLWIVILAAPSYGLGEKGIVIGRDIMVVFDLSKSMLAEDLTYEGEVVSRSQMGQLALRNMLEQLRGRGGYRVGLIVFAAKPYLISPLTTDIDHLLSKIEDLDPAHPPAEIYPAVKEENQAPDGIFSGTRIGTALAYALDFMQEKDIGYHHLLLFSDGDDPKNLDDVPASITKSLQRQIPIDVIAIGNPGLDSPIPDSDWNTRMQEQSLEKISTQTKGYIAKLIPNRLPELDDYVQNYLLHLPERELVEAGVRQLVVRYHLLLWVSLVFAYLSWDCFYLRWPALRWRKNSESTNLIQSPLKSIDLAKSENDLLAISKQGDKI